MIIYDPDVRTWELVCGLHGSVVPRTLKVSLPAGLAAAMIDFLFSVLTDVPSEFYDSHRTDQFLGTFTSVLGFLIVFRTRIAYTRFWEAASFLQTIRAGWFNAVSSCIAFCAIDKAKLRDVVLFQHTLVRLMSLLYAAALHEVALMEDNSFEVLDIDSFDQAQFDYMQYNGKKLEILLQWIQRLIMDAQRENTLDAPAPILSRVFQELSNGMIDLANAKRICRYPFPFPYAQIQAILLLVHWMLSVWIAGTTMGTPWRAFIVAFVSTFCLWSMHFIALEIEQPYGDDENDLPLDTMQTSLNDSLVNLLNPRTQRPVIVSLRDNDEIQCDLWRTHHDPNARMRDMKIGKKKDSNRKTTYQAMSISAAYDFLARRSTLSLASEMEEDAAEAVTKTNSLSSHKSGPTRSIQLGTDSEPRSPILGVTQSLESIEEEPYRLGSRPCTRIVLPAVNSESIGFHAEEPAQTFGDFDVSDTEEPAKRGTVPKTRGTELTSALSNAHRTPLALDPQSIGFHVHEAMHVSDDGALYDDNSNPSRRAAESSRNAYI